MNKAVMAIFYQFDAALQDHSARLAHLHLVQESKVVSENTSLSSKQVHTYRRTDNHYLFDIRLSFLVAKPVALLRAYITRADGRNLSISDYVRAHKTWLQEKDFTIACQSDDLSASLHSLIGAVLDLLEGELNPILSGERWENVPIDWQGYK